MPVGKGRLDVHLVKFGLVDTREQAQEAIAAKHVLVNGSIALKAAQQVRTTDAIRLLEDKRYVSRAGFKLERVEIRSSWLCLNTVRLSLMTKQRIGRY